MSCRTGVALLAGLSLSLGCGASPWLKGLEAAGKVQEESTEAQKAATDELAKLGHLICNGWATRYGVKAQAVLDARAEDARGVVGAAKKLTLAEADADFVRPYFDEYCLLARKVSVKFAAPASSPPALAPTGGAVSLPAAPAPAGPLAAPPVGAPIQPTPPVVVPVPVVPQ